MGKLINLVGNKYGRLTVLKFDRTEKNKSYWLCKCECGNEKIVRSDFLKSGKIISCGCYNKEIVKKNNTGIRKNLTGKKFGRLIVIKPVGKTRLGTEWLCKCECGKEKVVRGTSLTSKITTSCGCYSKELSTKRIVEVAKRNTGKKHYNYNPDLTDKERNDKRDTKENYNWRISVYKRDDYKCKKCDINSNKLQAHHIENYSNNKNKRFNINNGITLCYNCHKKFHKIYGNKNNNLNQLNEFLDNTEVRD